MARAELNVRIVPMPDGTDTFTLKLETAFVAEGRAPEIAAVTPQKAPELLVTFNKAYLDLTQAMAQLHLQRARAEDAVSKAKARILLDKVPEILKEKKLASSVDIRQAIIDSDPEYTDAKERLDLLEAMMEYVKGKVKFMENSYSAVKKILNDQNWNMTRAQAGRELSAGNEAEFGKPL